MPELLKVLELMITRLYCLWHCKWYLVVDHFKITGYLANIIISMLSFIAAFCSAPVQKKYPSVCIYCSGKMCPQGQLETICFVNYSFLKKSVVPQYPNVELSTENDCCALKLATVVLT